MLWKRVHRKCMAPPSIRPRFEMYHGYSQKFRGENGRDWYLHWSCFLVQCSALGGKSLDPILVHGVRNVAVITVSFISLQLCLLLNPLLAQSCRHPRPSSITEPINQSPPWCHYRRHHCYRPQPQGLPKRIKRTQLENTQKQILVLRAL